MSVIAITRIIQGADDGKVTTYEIGDTISGSDDELRSLVQGGSAVEMGKNKKYDSPLNLTIAADDETRKRDEIIAKANSESDTSAEAGTATPTEAEASAALKTKQEAEAKANADAAKKNNG